MTKQRLSFLAISRRLTLTLWAIAIVMTGVGFNATSNTASAQTITSLNIREADSPSFDVIPSNPRFNGNVLSYTVNVANSIDSIEMVLVFLPPTTSVTVLGNEFVIGEPSVPIPLSVGVNDVALIAATDSSMTTYTFTVTRASGPDDFITSWRAMGDEAARTVSFPGRGNYMIDWGDGTTVEAATAAITHTYASDGDYDVTVSGGITHFNLDDHVDAPKLRDVKQWGSAEWTSMERAFLGAVNMTMSATDAPDLSGVTNMSGMFFGAAAFNGAIGDWNVSSVTNMSSMFSSATVFNQDISRWDVRSATSMAGMFNDADAFSQNLGPWYIVPTPTTNYDGASNRGVLTLAAQNTQLDGHSPAYSLVAGIGNDNNASFSISGSNLVADEGLAVGTYSVRIGAASATSFGTENEGTIFVTVVLPATDARLSNLELSVGSLSPVFNSNTTAYTATVANSVENIMVTPTTLITGAAVSAGITTSVSVTSGSPTAALPLAVGANVIQITVTATDSVASQTYRITVTRAAPPMPNQPVGLNVVAGTPTASSLAISWSDPTPGGTTVTSYRLEYADNAEFTGTVTTYTPELGVAARTATVSTGLAEDTAYYFRLIALDATGTESTPATANGATSTFRIPDIADVQCFIGLYCNPPSLLPAIGARISGASVDYVISGYPSNIGGGADRENRTLISAGPSNKNQRVSPPVVLTYTATDTNGTADSADDIVLSREFRFSITGPKFPSGRMIPNQVYTAGESVDMTFPPAMNADSGYYYRLSARGLLFDATDSANTNSDTSATSDCRTHLCSQGKIAPQSQLEWPALGTHPNLTKIPRGLTFNPATRVLSGIPTVEELISGMRYVVLNSDDAQSTLSFVITVENPPVLAVPSPPFGLTAALNADDPTTELDLSWTAPINEGSGGAITSYEVQHSTSSSFTSPTTVMVTSTTTTIDGLTGGTPYWFRVRAVNPSGEGEYSESAQGIPGAPAGAPTALTVTLNAADPMTSLDVTWTAPTETGSGIVSYELDRSLSAAFMPADTTTVTLTGTTTTISRLSPGTTYHFRVRAVTTSAGAYSTVVQRATSMPVASAPPGMPTNLTVMSDATNPSTTVNVSWMVPTETGGVITSYDLQRSQTSDFSSEVDTTQYTTNSVRVTSLLPSTRYYFRVRAVNATGAGEYSSTVDITTEATPVVPTVPSAPRVLTAVRNAANPDTAINLSWSVPANTGNSPITSYNLQRATSADFTASLNTMSGVTGTTITVVALTSNTRYYFRISAVNSVGEGSYSNIANISTEVTQTPPGAPTGLAAVLNITNSATALDLNWTAPTNTGSGPITSYLLQRSTGSGFTTAETTTLNIDASETSITVSGLAQGTLYYFRVRALAAAGAGAYSNTAQAQTASLPSAPTDLTSAVNTANPDTAVDLSWTLAANPGTTAITSYELQYATNAGFTGSPTTIAIASTSTVSRTVSDLSANTNYHFRVRALSALGGGAWSNTAMRRTTVMRSTTVNAGSDRLLRPSTAAAPIDTTLTGTVRDTDVLGSNTLTHAWTVSAPTTTPATPTISLPTADQAVLTFRNPTLPPGLTDAVYTFTFMVTGGDITPVSDSVVVTVRDSSTAEILNSVLLPQVSQAVVAQSTAAIANRVGTAISAIARPLASLNIGGQSIALQSTSDRPRKLAPLNGVSASAEGIPASPPLSRGQAHGDLDLTAPHVTAIQSSPLYKMFSRHGNSLVEGDLDMKEMLGKPRL